MTVYMISQLTITDQDEYLKYQNKFMDVFEKFQGKVLSVDDDPRLIAGEWNANRSVLLEFPSPQAFKDWITSDEYQEISKHREAASTTNTILVQGGDNTKL